MADDNALLAEQVAYYRARAPEYDHWWHRSHQYTLPPADKSLWDREVADLEGWVDRAVVGGRVLEVACGTGVWTRRLAGLADHVTGVDASPEVLALNRAKLESAGATNVELVQADVFGWRPTAAYDTVFFAFWLSHVPPSRTADFWSIVGDALAPGGRVVFVDNQWAQWARPGPRPDGYVEERSDISDGRRFRIVKQYPEPAEIDEQLAALGWDSRSEATERFFVRGVATPR